MPGKTMLCSFLVMSSNLSPAPSRLATMMPPRGPRRVLWVVDVTTCACGTGLGYSPAAIRPATWAMRSEEHTSELQSLMRISYAVFCLKKKKKIQDRMSIQNRHKHTLHPKTDN